MLEIVFHKKARIEIDEAIDWYEEQKEGLGVDFVLVVDGYIPKIQETPNYYSYRKGNYRGIKMETFPYTIFYQVFPVSKSFIFARYTTTAGQAGIGLENCSLKTDLS